MKPEVPGAVAIAHQRFDPRQLGNVQIHPQLFEIGGLRFVLIRDATRFVGQSSSPAPQESK